MTAIGVFSDSGGDLDIFDAAIAQLARRGARRFFFAGGEYEDLDRWVKKKRDEVKGKADYSDRDFLEDLTRHLLGQEPLERPAAFGQAWELFRATEELTRLKDKVLRAPERGSLAYQDPSIPRKVLDLLGDSLCCIVHDKNDLDKDDMLNALVFVHGKSPEPKVVQIGPRVFLTPGRLDGKSPSVGLIEVAERQLAFSALTLSGEVALERQVLQVGVPPVRGKVTVK